MHKRLYELLNIEKIDIIVEVGARDCIDTNFLYKIFNKPKIYTYECNPIQTQICLDNLKQIDHNNDIIFCNYGLGEKKSIKPFYPYIANNIGASSFFKRIDFLYTQKKVDNINIETLYDEINKFNIPKIDLLIMDVQGYELNILFGCKEYISRIKYMVLEVPLENINPVYLDPKLHSKYIGAPTRKEILDYLYKNNFEILKSFYENELEENIVFVNKTWQEKIETN